MTVEVHTDDPGQRFRAGSVLETDPTPAGPLTVTAARWHAAHLLVTFAEVGDRTAAESLRGVWLTVDPASIPAPEDPDEFHDSQLTGMTVVTRAADVVGVVTDVLHHGQDLLVVRPAPGSGAGEVLVPFVGAIVVEVDVAAGRMVVDPPPGLLDLAAAGPGGAGRPASGERPRRRRGGG